MTKSRKVATAALVALALVLGALYFMGNTGGATHKTFTEVPAGMVQAQMMSTDSVELTKAAYCAAHPKYCLQNSGNKVFHKPLTVPEQPDDYRGPGCWEMDASTSVDSLPFSPPLPPIVIHDVVGATVSFRFCTKDGVHISAAQICQQVCTHHESYFWGYDGMQIDVNRTFWEVEGMGEAHTFSVTFVWAKGVQQLSWHKSYNLTCTGFISTYHPHTPGKRWNCS